MPRWLKSEMEESKLKLSEFLIQ
ncbi:hypothetical protein ACT4WO_19755 (plasmid) [Acinetobacter baumannii]